MPVYTVARNEPAGTQLRWLTCEEVPDGYHTPGQCVLANLKNHEPSYFAIASSPGEPLELLVKQQGKTALALGATEPGESLEVSEVIGDGFPVEDDHRTLVALVNGSGISALRPVIRREIARGLPRPVHLFYGVFTPDRRSFLADLEAWANSGVHVQTVVALPGGTGWTGASGMVQDLAIAQGLVRPDTAVVAAGVPAMIDAARELWEAVGAPVHVNF